MAAGRAGVARRARPAAVAVAAALALALAGCGGGGSASNDRATLDQLAQRVTHLEQQVADLEAAVVASAPAPAAGDTSGQSGSQSGAQAGSSGSGTAAAQQATVTTDFLNVRADPDQNSTQIGQLRKGTVVEVLGQKNGWSHVVLKQGGNVVVDGWVSSEYLEPQ
ncbi:MAG: SH3 domain-containing protein [Bacillota bacterium]|nr:SH3 domain-containing protein [Bacillota bacterium]